MVLRSISKSMRRAEQVLKHSLEFGVFVGSGFFVMNDDPFYSAKRRIERAEEHLDDLESKIDAFFAGKPYSQAIDPDPDGIHEIYKVRLTKRFPYRWRLLATEIVEHLRASLDHATWATAYLATRDPNLKFGVFPFSDSAANFENRMRGSSKDVPTEIQALLRTFQPYKGGNDELYTLNDLCNLSKHALIAFIACTPHTGEISAAGGEWDKEIGYFRPPIWDRAKNEIPYARVKRGARFDHRLKLRVYVSLDYRELRSTEPATAVLDAFRREAERVVLAIEAESRRIGLIT